MRSKHVLRTLGVSLLAALGLMAFAVASVQAANLKPSEHVHGEILILGKKLQATATGAGEGEGRLLVASLGIEITCPDFEVIEGLVNQTAAKGHGTADVLFLGCQVYAIEKTAPFNLTSKTVPPETLPCLPLDSVTAKDGHIRAKALLLVVLHENKDYLIAEAVNLTGPLAKIVFSPGTGCPIPLKPEVSGEVAFEINTGDKHTGLEVVEPLITGGSKTVQELLGVKLLYGVNESFIDGSAKLKLTGAHLGCIWGVL